MSEEQPPEAAGPHVVIVGLMGVGKSTTGRALADELGRRHVDSDTDIEKLVGCSGAEFAVEHGVSLLHELEAAVLLGALVSGRPSVISAASSTIENHLVGLALPRRAIVVKLQVPHPVALARQSTGSHRRPMAIEELKELAARREPYFAALSDLDLDAQRPTNELVAAVVAHLESTGRI